MSYLPAIEALKSEIFKDREQISGLERALGEKEFVLEKLIGWHEGRKASEPGVIDRQVIALPELQQQNKTLIGEIRGVIQKLGGQEFQVPQLEAILGQNGFKVTGKYPRARISSELATLVKNKEIVRTYEGKGSVPHKYQQLTGGVAGTAQRENNA